MADENEVLTTVVEEQKPQRKGKIGAKVFDQYGNLEKKKRAMQLGISDLLLPPFTRKTVATYRLLGTDRIDPSSGQLADPKSATIPGTYMLYDKGQQDPTSRKIMMKNLGRPQIVMDKISGKQVIDDDMIDWIEFIYGVKKVNVESDYRLYAFIELHPLNKSNRFRPNGVAPKFERVDLISARSVASEMALRDMAMEAEKTVIDFRTKDEIIAYATSAGIPTMEHGKPRDPASLKMDLRKFAYKDPLGFYKLGGGNQEAAVRMTVLDAISWGLIEYHPTKKAFFLEQSNESLKPVHTVGPQEDPTESLVKYLSKQEDDLAQELYQGIYDMVNYWQN